MSICHSDQYIIANPDNIIIKKSAIHIDNHLISDKNVFATLATKVHADA